MSRSRCPHCGFPLTAREAEAAACPSCHRPLFDFGRGEVGAPAGPAPEDENALLSSLTGETPAALGPITTQAPAAPKVPSPHTAEMMGTLTLGTTPTAVALRWGAVRAALATVGTGLFFGIVGLLLQLAAGPGEPGRLTVLKEVLGQVAGLTLFAGGVLVLAGQFLCTAVPAGSRAERWALGTAFCLALGVIGVVLYVVATAHNGVVSGYNARIGFAEPLPWDPNEVRALGFAAVGTVALGNVLFALFLRSVALHFRHAGLASSLIWFIVLSVAVGLGIVLDPRAGDVRLAEALGGVLGLGWLLVEVLLVRDAIARGLLRPRA